MDKNVGNLEVLIDKKTKAYCSENVTVKITSRAKPHKSYSSITNDGIHSKHMAKFTNIPLGFYDLEALCKGYINKKESVQVKFSGEDTHWNGSFRKSRNRTQIEILAVQWALLKINDDKNSKENYPFSNYFLENSIKHGDDLYFDSNSELSKSIANSSEIREMLKANFKDKKYEGSYSQSIIFTKNRDLARTLHAIKINIMMATDGKNYKYSGSIEDEYDFRLDFFPKNNTSKGLFLRTIGNIAYVGQETHILGNFHIKIDLEDKGKFE